MKLDYNHLYYFHYNDPVTRHRLTVWDKRPLVLPLYIPNTTHFLAINIHWVPKQYQKLFVKRLKKFIDNTVVKRNIPRLTYLYLKNTPSLKLGIRGIRRYRVNRMLNVNPIPINKLDVDLLSQHQPLKFVNRNRRR